MVAGDAATAALSAAIAEVVDSEPVLVDESLRRGADDRRAQRALLDQSEDGWPGEGDSWRQSGVHLLETSPSAAAHPFHAVEDEVELTLSAEEIIPEGLALEETSAEPHELLPATDEVALRSARQLAQEALVREMQEALRRSGSGGDDEWLSESPAEAEPPPPRVRTPPPAPESWRESGIRQAPLILGPAAPEASPEDDLWRIVSFDRTARAPGSSTSAFEEAIGRVDASLVQLVEDSADGGLDAPFEVEFQAFETLPPVGEVVSTRENPLPVEQGAVFADDAELDDSEWTDDEDDLADDDLDPAEAARRRRQRLLRRAMDNMGVLSGLRTPAPDEAPAAPTSTPAPRASPVPASTPAPGASAIAFKDALERRFRELEGPRDHFRILGLAQSASRDQVKGAFLQLVKQFHPDRLPQDLPQLAPQISAVFEAIREAYDVLYDDQRRATWLATRERTAARVQAAVPARQGDAQVAFKKGELAMRKRDFTAAEEAFGQAQAIDPKAGYLAAQAWALYMDPTRRAEAPRARAMMQQAVQSDPNCDRAHYQLGVIARVDGNLELAERHFREAVRSNPKHLEANQELRLIDMRRKRGLR